MEGPGIHSAGYDSSSLGPGSGIASLPEELCWYVDGFLTSQSQIFPRAYLAAAHEKACSKLNTNGDPKPFKCKVCRKGFVKKAAMLQHQEESHKGFGEKEKISKEKKKPTPATTGSTEGEIIP